MLFIRDYNIIRISIKNNYKKYDIFYHILIIDL